MKALVLPMVAVMLAACQKPPATLGFEVVATHPHDPECYTQGLEFHGSRLFESGGGYGLSTVREVDPASGRVLRKRPLAKHVFAEGITVLNNELWVLTWKEKTAYVLEPDTFRFLRTHQYQGEGWGLTHNGQQLIMSDGSATLRFINPADFSVQRTLEVTDSGRPLNQLNELEFADGHLYANIYQTDRIARISPDNGEVTGWLDLAPLRRQLPPPHRAEVLNGIARLPDSGNLLVTGKLWPTMFELRLDAR